MLGALAGRSQQGLVEGSQGQEISQAWESGWSCQDGISGAQCGGPGFAVPGKGRPMVSRFGA